MEFYKLACYNLSMKKLILVFLCLILFGCDKNQENKNLAFQSYNDMKQLLQTNQKYNSKFEQAKLSIEVDKVDKEYRYYVFLDNPKIAMYNISAMAIIDDQNYDNIMAANFGIFEDVDYNMIPNQNNVKNGFIKGFMMSGSSSKPNFKLKILVQWQNENNSKLFQEFVLLDGNYNKGGKTNE